MARCISTSKGDQSNMLRTAEIVSPHYQAVMACKSASGRYIEGCMSFLSKADYLCMYTGKRLPKNSRLTQQDRADCVATQVENGFSES